MEWDHTNLFGGVPSPPRVNDLPDTGQAFPAIINEPMGAAVEPAQEPECAAVNWDEDRAPHEREPKAILDHALTMAARGFRVFPITPGDKVPPRGLAWKAEATTDPVKIRAWWSFEPNYNYAVAAGEGTLIVDVDAAKGGYASLLELALPEATFTVKTPGGGEHRYYAGPDVQNSVDRIAPGIDIRSAGGYVVGPGSFFADPGGKKGYADFYKIECDAPPATAPEGLVLACGIAGTRERDASPLAEQDRPEDIERAARFLVDAAPAVEGEGGDARTFRLACDLRDFGLTEGTALAMMAGEWNARCLPPWSREELATKVANAFSYGQNRPAAKSTAAMAEGFGDAVTLDTAPAASPSSAGTPSPLALADFLKQFPLLGSPIMAGQPRPAVPWLMKKVLPRRGVGVLYGQSTAGKSYLVLDMARSLWRGEDWYGAKVKERRATVIFAFEGADFMGFRLDAIKAAHGEDPAIVVIPAGRMNVGGLRSIEPALKRIAKDVKDTTGLDVGLVVVDTVSAAGLAEDEDKAKDVGPALKAVADFAATVDAFGLLVHHPNKTGTLRGSGAWFNDADVVIRVEPDSGGSVREIDGEKIKNAPKRVIGHFVLEEVLLGKDDDGDPITACVVAPSEKPTPRAVGGHKHFGRFIQAFEEVADGATHQGRPVAAIAKVQAAFRESVAHDYGSDAGVRGAWKKCLDQAEKAGVIKPVRGERNVFTLTEAAYAAEDPNLTASGFEDANPIQGGHCYGHEGKTTA